MLVINTLTPPPRKINRAAAAKAFSERLRLELSARGVLIVEFARQTGLPYRTIQNHLVGTRSPGMPHLLAYARAGIDLNWLVTGHPARYP